MERIPRLRKINVIQNVKQTQSESLVFIAHTCRDVPEFSDRHNDESYLLKPRLHLLLPSLVLRIVREGELKPCARRHHHQPLFLVMLRFRQKHCLFTSPEAQSCHAIFLQERNSDTASADYEDGEFENDGKSQAMCRKVPRMQRKLCLALPRWFIRCQE